MGNFSLEGWSLELEPGGAAPSGGDGTHYVTCNTRAGQWIFVGQGRCVVDDEYIPGFKIPKASLMDCQHHCEVIWPSFFQYYSTRENAGTFCRSNYRW